MNDITLMQGIMLSIMALVVGIDFWLETLYIFRPLIVCTLTGIILGDVQTGLITGALTELAFTGLTPIGGTQPPNPVMAGIMTTVIAHSTGVDAKTAIGLGLPFSFLMQYIILFYYSMFSFFMQKADRYAEEANIGGLTRLCCLLTGIVAVTYGLVTFLCAYLAQGLMQTLVSSMPQWLTHGFEVAGGVLPAVGFGLLLKVMLKVQFVPFFIVGFLFVTFIPMQNLLPVALIGAAFAIYEYFNSQRKAAATPVAEDTQDGI